MAFAFTAIVTYKLSERDDCSLIKGNYPSGRRFQNCWDMGDLASQPFEPFEQIANEKLSAVEKYMYFFTDSGKSQLLTFYKKTLKADLIHTDSLTSGYSYRDKTSHQHQYLRFRRAACAHSAKHFLTENKITTAQDQVNTGQ